MPMPRKKVVIGKNYGRLVPLHESGKSKNGFVTYLCKCSCGKTTTVAGTRLFSGHTKSCGCYQREQTSLASIKHGHSVDCSPEYTAWRNMKARCGNPNFKQWNDYGGRGISVCKRWMKSFQNFLDDMGHKPSERHTLDRIDVDGNYCADNCRWATRHTQRVNRRSPQVIANG